MLENLMDGLGRLRAKGVFKHSRYRSALDDLPVLLFERWRGQAKKEFPAISGDAIFLSARRWA